MDQMMKSSSSRLPPQPQEMWVEVCIVSARGLRRQSLWKLQWFAVAWVDPSNKYCTRFDTSGNPNPVWRTKFNASLDADSDSDCTLHVEVHSRDSVFLIDKLHGSAEVSLKEFLAKHQTDGVEDVGSFQLRKRGSNQPKGFVDVSIRTSLDKELGGVSTPTGESIIQI